MNDNPPSTDDASPLSDFSRCHVGILEHLHTFGELPGLLAPAARAREIAASTLRFFNEAVFDHHADEEKELFPAVLERAGTGPGAERLATLVRQLRDEHRVIEATWVALRPAVEKAAAGQDTALDTGAVADLVRKYTAHARLEEQELLPLCAAHLAADGRSLAELGLQLHIRHTVRDWRRHGLRGS